MLKTTRKLMGQCDDIMKMAMEQIGVKDVLEMDDETFKMTKASMEMYITAMELAEKQAEIIEDMNNKIDQLIEINKILLSKAEGLQ